MSRVLADTDYFRLDCCRVLKTNEGKLLVGQYITRNEEENERIKIVFQHVCEECDKNGDMTLEQIINIVQNKYHVSIKVETCPLSEPKPFEKPKMRKVFLKITKIPHSIRPHKQTKKA